MLKKTPKTGNNSILQALLVLCLAVLALAGSEAFLFCTPACSQELGPPCKGVVPFFLGLSAPQDGKWRDIESAEEFEDRSEPLRSAALRPLEGGWEMINLLEYSWEDERKNRSWIALGISASSRLFSEGYSLSKNTWSAAVAASRPFPEATPSGLGDLIKTALFYIHFTIEY